MTLKTHLIALAISAIALPAVAQPVEIILGSGDPGGTYYPVITEIGEFCNSNTLMVSHYMDPDTPENPTSGGSVANLQRITNNLAMGGLVQADVAALEVLGRNPAMTRVLALLPLHTEHVHFIVRSSVTVLLEEAVEANFFRLGGKDAVYGEGANLIRTVSQLEGQVIASWGGSAVSSQVIDQLARLGAQVENAGSRDAAMAMLDRGEVAAVVSVAGAPVQWISDLPRGEYSLLEVSERTVEDLASVYGTQPVSYNNTGANGQRIDALTVNALLMTRTYRTPEMINALAELQACVQENIFLIQDTPGTHPAWQAIDPNAEMLWDNLFQVPSGFTYRASSLDPSLTVIEGGAVTADGN
jgi:TRAP-type uncharacterized transport system substrate-binding protein